MVAYSFQKQFAAPILEGTKRQTIRADRHRHARPGEVLQLFTGMRTRHCRRLGTATCQSISPITLNFDARRIVYRFADGTTTIYPGGLDDFARHDGFADWPAMRAFWAKTHPPLPAFSGWLVRWSAFHPDAAGSLGG